MLDSSDISDNSNSVLVYETIESSEQHIDQYDERLMINSKDILSLDNIVIIIAKDYCFIQQNKNLT